MQVFNSRILEPIVEITMTSNFRTLPTLFCGVLFVSACCKPGIRPEDANLFQAFCGVTTGDFDKQLESDKYRAAASRQALDAERSKTEILQTDLETKKMQRDQLLKELRELETENQKMEAQISKMLTDSTISEQKHAGLEAELRRIQDKLADLKQKASVEQEALDQYLSEKSQLKQEIETLRMIISAQ